MHIKLLFKHLRMKIYFNFFCMESTHFFWHVHKHDHISKTFLIYIFFYFVVNFFLCVHNSCLLFLKIPLPVRMWHDFTFHNLTIQHVQQVNLENNVCCHVCLLTMGFSAKSYVTVHII